MLISPEATSRRAPTCSICRVESIISASAATLSPAVSAVIVLATLIFGLGFTIQFTRMQQADPQHADSLYLRRLLVLNKALDQPVVSAAAIINKLIEHRSEHRHPAFVLFASF